MRQIRAVFSYWTLLHRRGLPLYSLVFDQGTISVAREPHEAPAPRSAASRLETLTYYLDGLSGISRHFELIDVVLSADDRRPFAEHMNAVAHRAHYRGGAWPWIVTFKTDLSGGSLAGAKFSGELELGHLRDAPGTLARGRVWFGRLPLRDLRLGNLKVSADLDGDLQLAVSKDAQATGSFTLSTANFQLDSAALNSSLKTGSLWSHCDYRIGQASAELINLELHQNKSLVFEGRASLLNPYGPNRAVKFSASGIELELTNAVNWLRSFRALSPKLDLLQRITSGELKVTQVALKNPESLDNLNLQKLIRKLVINAELTDLSYVPPPDWGLPTLYDFDAQLNYSGSVAQIIQATGQIGGSSISDLDFDADLSMAPDQISYELKLASWLDVGEAYAATSNYIQRAVPRLRGRLLWVHGHTPIQLEGRGELDQLLPSIPQDYVVTADLGDVQFELSKMPGAIWLNSGSIVVEPRRISFRKVVALPLNQAGNIVLNGAILPGSQPPEFRDFSVELHQLSADKWLPLVANPDQIAVFGPIGGKLVANSTAGKEVPTVVGKLTLDHGTVQPGFLRNPMIVTHSATLVLDGKGMVLDLPATWLEGEPLNFRMAVADLNNPEVRIDARVLRLDFEAMRFIRLPWSPSTAPQFFPVPVMGHIEAQAGNFDKLAMSRISTDFYHDNQTWQVTNFRATAFDGSVALTISGRQRDDWVNIKGEIAHMDAGPLFLLSGNNREAPIIGKLAARGDLWANTNTDFFSTLGGTLSVTITDGILNRFTLMKRILSLVNLKNYLTVQFPDPRKSGVPFKSLDADFRGHNGNFYTDNLRLNGPVMDITARGNIDMASSTMDMEIVLLALQTVNWLINKVPLIGRHLGGATKELVGAYFQVRGPTDNPSIRPKPLTSVAEFVLRTLTLPINIIAPNTIE